MNSDTIQLLVLPERPVARSDQTSELDVLIEIRSKRVDIDAAGPRALNLAIVIDRSGSMEGVKLETAKTACSRLLSALRKDDLLTVVTFHDDAQVIINPQVTRETAATKIQQITSGGQTNLSLGWYLGLLELQTYATPQHNNRLILLSDGQANAGETKKSVLAADAFRSRELGITTSTVGIGDDFQEDLLETIATESGGRFWYIRESRIEDIIEEEFQGSLSTILDRPRVELILPSGLVVSRELNTLSKIGNKHRVRPLKGDDNFNFALRLEIRNPAQAEVRIGAFLYDGDKVITEASTEIRLVPVSEFVKVTPNALVTSAVQQFESSVSNEQMLTKMAEGDLDLMKKMLIAEVDGMRVVRDALEQQPETDDTDRILLEIQNLSMDMAFKDASITVADMLQTFASEPEVAGYVLRWRKIMMHNKHRMANRHLDVHDFDEDLFQSLLQGAIDLADILIARYPDRAARLLEQQGELREHLARR